MTDEIYYVTLKIRDAEKFSRAMLYMLHEGIEITGAELYDSETRTSVVALPPPAAGVVAEAIKKVRAKRERYLNGQRNKGIKGSQLIDKLFAEPNDALSREQVQWHFANHKPPFSPKSAGPELSKAVRDKRLVTFVHSGVTFYKKNIQTELPV